MDFKLVELNGVLHPVFEAENRERWVRSAFLRDAESRLSELIGLVRQARDSSQPFEWSGNEVWVDFFPGGAVITAQWMRDDKGAELEIEISLDEAEQLLSDWQKALREYHSRRQ